MDFASFFTSIFTSCAGWFEKLLSSSGVSGWLLASIGVYASIRFLLIPIFGGSAGSDKSKKKNNKSDGDSE